MTFSCFSFTERVKDGKGMRKVHLTLFKDFFKEYPLIDFSDIRYPKHGKMNKNKRLIVK